MKTEDSAGRSVEDASTCCIRYLRVSDPRQTYTDADVVADGNSIDTQRKACQARERKLGLVCIAEYIEPGNSAQSIEKRKEFRRVLKHFNEKHDAAYLSIYMRSRAFRNHIDAAVTKRQLQQLGVKIISAKEDFGDGIWADAMEAITDVMNEVQVRQNGEDISTKMANKAKNGGTPGAAKLGYVNVTRIIEGKRVNTIAPDPERSGHVLTAFELFATGDYSVKRLQQKMTEIGLRSRPTTRYPSGRPVGLESLRKMLQNRYYVGWLTYRGIEYKGRHETFIPEELFDRVQRVFAAHQGAGARERTHMHYLKGWLWCNRCGRRFIVQRAVGRRGGEYYYFFCIGRQDKICDQPYIPVEVIEKELVRYYKAAVYFPEYFRAGVRAMIDDANQEDRSLTVELREKYIARLKKLDDKESYFLDLGAEEGWPKDKLRDKINGVRRERKDIAASLQDAENYLSDGVSLLYRALDLLDDPGKLYEQGDETVRSLLNKAIFNKFMIDGRKVTGHELREPFDALDEAYKREQQRRSYQRTVGAATGAESLVAGSVPRQRGQRRAARRLSLPEDAEASGTSADLLDLALQAQGSSKPAMVEYRGLEPRASAMRMLRSSQTELIPRAGPSIAKAGQNRKSYDLGIHEPLRAKYNSGVSAVMVTVSSVDCSP
jgi:site-specific DNA recombinase